MSDHSLEARVETLETTVAYQDKTIEDLSTALAAQFKEIEVLKQHLARLGEKVEDITAQPALTPEREPPPPHY
jgi:SlyX protein